jgi:hypothetical protein
MTQSPAYASRGSHRCSRRCIRLLRHFERIDVLTLFQSREENWFLCTRQLRRCSQYGIIEESVRSRLTRDNDDFALQAWPYR